jgi:hypothetical protein
MSAEKLEPGAAKRPKPRSSRQEVKGAGSEREQIPAVPHVLDHDKVPLGFKHAPDLAKEEDPLVRIPELVSGEDDEGRALRAIVQRDPTDVDRDGCRNGA